MYISWPRYFCCAFGAPASANPNSVDSSETLQGCCVALIGLNMYQTNRSVGEPTTTPQTDAAPALNLVLLYNRAYSFRLVMLKYWLLISKGMYMYTVHCTCS